MLRLHRKTIRPFVQHFSNYNLFTSTTSFKPTTKNKQIFAISKLATETSPRQSIQLEEIFASLDGALHLHYAKFGQSLQALYSSFEPSSTKSTTVASTDSDFPAAFCPTEPSHENNNDATADATTTTSTTTTTTLNQQDDHGRDIIDIQKDHNLQVRQHAFRMTSCFVWLARRAAFSPITLEDQSHAANNHFLMTTPVRVLWDYFDDCALNLDGKTHYDQFETINPPKFSSRLLMLKRGRGTTTTKGYYIMEKIDELTNRSTNNIKGTAKKKFLNITNRIKSSTSNKLNNLNNTEKTDNIEMNKDSNNGSSRNNENNENMQKIETNSSNISTSSDTTKSDFKKPFKKPVHEMSTRSKNDVESSSAWSNLDITSIRTFVKPVTLEEPAYDDLLMLQSPAEWREKDITTNTNWWRSLIFGLDESRKPNYDINISHFRKVPRSDLELILPADALVVKLRPSLLVNYGLVGVGAVILAGSLVWHGMELSGAGAIASSGLILYLSRAGFKYYMSKLYYKSSVTQYLSSNCIATNRASIHSILFEARQQDFRCMSIVCCALWKHQEEYADVDIGAIEKEMNLEELLLKCQELSVSFSLDKKVTIDIERLSNALHWLEINNIIFTSTGTDENKITTTVGIHSIDTVHSDKNNMIQLACENHNHMWKSLGVQ